MKNIHTMSYIVNHLCEMLSFVINITVTNHKSQIKNHYHESQITIHKSKITNHLLLITNQ